MNMDDIEKIRNITQLTSQICSYILLLIIIFGVLGNIISIIVFQKGRICSMSYSAKYFKCLAIADINVLLMSALWKWVSSRSDLIHLNTIFTGNQLFCQLIFFNENFPVQISTWITVFVTVERTLCLLYPLKFRNMFAEKWIYLKVICIVIVFALCNIYAAMSAKGADNNCFHNMSIWYSFVMLGLMVFLLPTVINGVCNAIMLRILYRRASDSVNSGLPDWTSRARRTEAKYVTYRVVAIGVVHFVSTLPMSLFFFYLNFSNGNHQLIPYYRLFQVIASTMYYFNSGVNVVFFCLIGRDFRQDVKRLFCSCCYPRTMTQALTEYVTLSQVRHTRQMAEL